MCRWLAYYGDSIPIEALILRRQHSLIDQSLHSREERRRRTATALALAGTPNWEGYRACTKASSPPGTTATCASSRRTSRRRSFSRTSEHPPARPSRRRMRILSGTAAGFSCTMGWCESTHVCVVISCLQSTRRYFRRSRARATQRCSSTSRSRSASRMTPHSARAHGGLGRGSRRAPWSRASDS